MQQFTFHSPTDVWFGRGAETHIAEYMKKYGRTRVLIVTGGSSVKRSGAFDRVCDLLRADGIEYTELSGVKANPVLSKAREGIELAKEFRPDLVLGFGGGSVIAFGLPDENILFVAVTRERYFLKFGGVIYLLSLGVGQEIVLRFIPPADAGIESEFPSFFIAAGNIRHVVFGTLSFA